MPTGRHSTDDIEITPEMIAAGAEAVDPYDRPFLDHAEQAEIIFRAMLLAARRESL